MSKIISFIKDNLAIIILLMVIITFFAVTLSRDALKKKVTYTIVEGAIEKSQETNLYFIKNEEIVEYDSSLSVIAIVDQGKRASKNEVIAAYKNDSYDNYLNEIAQIDKQIQTLVVDLPTTYSTDIANIEGKILQGAMQAQGTNSYIKMQEYKTKLDGLSYKKIGVLANASPEDSAIRELLRKREELEKLSKGSSGMITTKKAGIVTYKIDGAEEKYDYSNVKNMKIQDLSDIINLYDNSLNSQFGIKVVDNFGAYLLVKTPRGDNDQYIIEGRNYKIRISDLENRTLYANLYKNLQDEEYNYSLFNITDEIDEFVDYRKLSCEVVWKTFKGMAVPLNSIYTKPENNQKYVLMVYGTDYVEVPITINESSDSIAIVDNLTKEEKEKYGFDSRFTLELFDELIIK